MRTLTSALVFAIGALLSAAASATPVNLGAFAFESTLFGNTLTESDGGTHSAGNWLNIVNADPGNPGYLTGPTFDTGIANIGLGSGPLSYTIGYNTGIVNGAGDDLGVVVARYSTDAFLMAVSTNGGGTFSSDILISTASAVSSGVGKSYFYGGNGPFAATLFVHSLDLASFGIGGGASINAVRISIDTNQNTGNELDLIRVAGFSGGVAVPEPATVALLGLGLAGLGVARRRRGQS